MEIGGEKFSHRLSTAAFLEVFHKNVTVDSVNAKNEVDASMIVKQAI